ncbi:RNA 2'-phosphotransferase [Nonomuraea africana]|uniref:Probable RNA 2'-phosphotransferase n=1 Tax=Nonomuraea africana TaxID=46171 RepID=A0ABR9KBD7_9ACTN|nr:RNA 2'-phosphotransferase [Nonomuraea africana]MBE1558867.1 putative RNA 2'-phosphotransferase [Nonomuraea africana]
MTDRTVRISKYLAKHLRHDPGAIGITLDAQGWVPIDELLDAAARDGFPITRDELSRAVSDNDKQRYAIAGDLIRASQGHSVAVDLGLPPVEPPAILYHGTAPRSLAAIKASGLLPMSRQYVHLSADRATAERVGARRGTPVMLVVASGEMHAGGHEFRVSANGVWLADAVPPEFLRFPG